MDVLCEFFEVVVHNLLFIRKLYPETIFEERKKYDTLVYQCIQPQIVEYISGCLAAIKFHGVRNQLKRIFICINTETNLIEKHIIDVFALNSISNTDKYLVDLEQKFRTFLLKLHTRDSYLDDLPPDARFSIRIQVSFSSSVEFNQEPKFEDFPWIEIEETESSIDTPDIVPLYSVDSSLLKLQMYIEKQSQ